MPTDLTNHFDQPTSSWAQRVLGVVLLVAVGSVLWQAAVGIVGYWNLQGSNGLPLGFWLFWVAVSPLLLYLSLGLVVGRFRQRRWLSGNALILVGIVLLLATAGIATLLVWSSGLKALDQGILGGVGIGVLAILIGRRRREGRSRADA